VNLPNAGNVTNLPDGSVVEIMGEFLRRINVVQEWTVEAAISGDRTLVLEAMMADPMAGQLAYDDIVTMTDEMLAATAGWLPQFRL
jgi:alpha-galactosidase/6-phospho-beta-glucosidase family protein